MSETLASRAQGVWAWILQRVSAVVLLLLLGIHMFVMHYIPGEPLIEFASVQVRVKSLLFQVVDAGLLSFVLYHAFNGLRAVIFDFGVSEGWQRTVNWVLIVAGVGLFILGILALRSFIG